MQIHLVLLYTFLFVAVSCTHKAKKWNIDRIPNAVYAGLPTREFVYKGDKIRVMELESIDYLAKLVQTNDLLLAVHASDLTDPRRLTRNAILKAHQFVQSLKGTSLQLVMRDEAKSDLEPNYPLGISNVFPFEGDSHRISHTGHRLFLTGGNLTRCLCTALDAYLAFKIFPHNKVVTVVLLMDGIYEGYFENPKAEQTNQTSLEVISKNLDDTAFSNFLSSRFITTTGRPCPDYSVVRFTENLSRSFKYTIFRDGKILFSAGTGDYSVNLIFTNSVHYFSNEVQTSK